MNLNDNLIHMTQTDNFYKNKINIALIGAGRTGNCHLQSLLQFSHFNLCYIIDKDLSKARTLTRMYGDKCLSGTDIDLVLLDYNIQAVIIATNTHTHYDITIKCLDHHKHVLCEKPLDNIKECFEKSQKMNRRLLLGYHKRFDSNYQQLIKKISLESGKLTGIKMTLKDNFMPSIKYLKQSGGIVKDMLTYDIDIINILMKFQMPKKVVAFHNTYQIELQDNNEIENIEVLLQYPQGELVTITSSRNTSYGYDHRMEVTGSFGLIQMENASHSLLKCHTKQNSNIGNIQYNFQDRFKESYLNELNYFYHMIENNYINIITPENLELNYTICDLINNSIRENKIINSNKDLRTYDPNTAQYLFYQEQHRIQSLEYVESKLQKYHKLDNKKMTMLTALGMLDTFIDPSDPDLDLPNSIHAYQTAERIRRRKPLDKALQITGLIHDVGKVLFSFGEPSHTVVGDTFVVGCAFPESIVYHHTLQENPDFHNSNLNTKLGIYEEKCGIENLKISFGHDEYLYLVLQHNTNHQLSDKYQNIIRFHSFYPWHTGESYQEFMTETDTQILEDVLDFNQYDLYSKEDTDFILTEDIKEYYQKLIEKFFPKELQW